MESSSPESPIFECMDRHDDLKGKHGRVLFRSAVRPIEKQDVHVLIAAGCMGFKGCHALINSERVYRDLPLLKRRRSLDKFSQFHAVEVACALSNNKPWWRKRWVFGKQRMPSKKSNQLLIDIRKKYHKLGLAVNVLTVSGLDAKDIHEKSLRDPQCFHNLTNKTFHEFGAATSRSVDGTWFLVFAFRSTWSEHSIHSGGISISDSSVKAEHVISVRDWPVAELVDDSTTTTENDEEMLS